MTGRFSSWLIPATLLAAGAIAIGILWAPDEAPDAQKRVHWTMIFGGTAAALALAWFGFLAPLRRQVRLVGTCAVLLTLLAALAAFRIEGVSGDFVPILRPRWAPRPGARLGTEPAAAVGAAPGTQRIDFPQFFGPDRNGSVPGVRLSKDWSKVKTLWRRDVGAGWSGFAVVGARAVTQEQRGPDEMVVCYEVDSGRTLWEHADLARYETTLGGIGPRATPAISKGRLYSLGATGILNCLDLATGRAHWSVDLVRDAGARVPEWGFAGSPLVEANLVIVGAGVPGALVAAYDLDSGRRVWAAGNDGPGYASPMIAVLAGHRQILMIGAASCSGHEIESGRVLWRYGWRGDQPKTAQPVVLGSDGVVISAGYGVGADAFRVAANPGGWSVQVLWRSPYLKAKFANFVARAGRLYGLDDGALTALDAETGERTWRGRRYGHGQLLLADDLLLLTAENGEAALVQANPSEFRELSRLRVFDDKTWNSPALAGRLLVVRNDREAACLELPAP